MEVYQKALAVCVAVIKRVPLSNKTCPPTVIEKLHQAVLELPVLLASAHSIRFSYPDEAVKRLEEAMLKCNLAVVYLEQYRDLRKIQDPGLPDSGSRRIRLPESSDRDLEPIETEFFEEQIKNLLTCRMKTMHLQMSWKKFFAEKKTEALRK